MKKLLYEVSIIRPLVIFLLVVTHSMCFFNDGWDVPEGVEQIPTYRWISAFISGFRIETIALVAGYVFSFQSFDLHRKYVFLPFAKKKFKRLIIPALIFGTAYYFIFLFEQEAFSIGSFLMKLFSGVAHLWSSLDLHISIISYALVVVFLLYIFLSVNSLQERALLPNNGLLKPATTAMVFMCIINSSCITTTKGQLCHNK